MVEIISKELLSEVFTDNQQSFKIKSMNKNIFKYSWLNEWATYDYEGSPVCQWVDKEINIHELEYKCRIWAFDNGYEIVQLSKSVKIYKNGIEVFYLFSKIDDKEIYSMDMIFKCYQWILDNKESE